MKKPTKKAFIIYKYDQFKNDFEYIKEYYTTKEILKDFETLQNKKSIYNYITDSIDNIKELLQDKYIIIKENIEEETILL